MKTSEKNLQTPQELTPPLVSLSFNSLSEEGDFHIRDLFDRNITTSYSDLFEFQNFAFRNLTNLNPGSFYLKPSDNRCIYHCREFYEVDHCITFSYLHESHYELS
ncbi:MAG: hypothetical protein J0H55_13550 [Chitinophagaceae bacterium]|nr:hypothetical protein [Chitinophagaceae bacterium]